MSESVAGNLREGVRAWDMRQVFGFPDDGSSGESPAWEESDPGSDTHAVRKCRRFGPSASRGCPDLVAVCVAGRGLAVAASRAPLTRRAMDALGTEVSMNAER